MYYMGPFFLFLGGGRGKLMFVFWASGVFLFGFLGFWGGGRGKTDFGMFWGFWRFCVSDESLCMDFLRGIEDLDSLTPLQPKGKDFMTCET